MSYSRNRYRPETYSEDRYRQSRSRNVHDSSSNSRIQTEGFERKRVHENEGRRRERRQYTHEPTVKGKVIVPSSYDQDVKRKRRRIETKEV